MALKDKEKFVADIINDYFSRKHKNVSYSEGQDPPDIYLEYNSNKIGIELTEFSPNLYKDRVSIDKAYEGFIKSINIVIPDYTSYLVVFHHANIKLNKALKKEIKEFLNRPNSKMEKCINGVNVKIKAIPIKKKSGTILQMSLNMNSCSRDINTISTSLMDTNIEYVFGSIINKAIETKKEKCKNINKPIWLAMHDSYFYYIFSQSSNESLELYKNIMKNIDFGIFEKIIITFNNKGIIVFDR
jgi:hypothetical protein